MVGWRVLWGLLGCLTLALLQAGCAQSWTVATPARVPEGALATWDVGANVEALPGFLADGRTVIVWACDPERRARGLAHNLVEIDRSSGQMHMRCEDLRLVGFDPRGVVALSGIPGGRTWEPGVPYVFTAWNWLASENPIVEFSSREPVTRCVVSPDGSVLAVSGPGLALYDARDGRLLRTLAERAGEAVFTRDGRLVAAGVAGGEKQKEVGLWRVADGERVGTLVVPYEGVSIVGISATGKTLVLREQHWAPAPPGYRGLPQPISSVLVYDMASGRQVLQTRAGAILAAGDTRLLVPLERGGMEVYALDSGRLERTIPGTSGPAAAGDLVALVEGGRDARAVGFWEITTGQKVGAVKLTDPRDDVVLRGLSPDGRFAVLGRYQLIAVDRVTGRTILDLSAPTRRDLSGVEVYAEQFTGVAFSADGRYLVFDMGRYVGIADLVKLAAEGK